MTTFYDLLNIDFNETKDNIKIAYKNKIKNYKYKKLNDDDILEIKQLKTALFILFNDDFRELYNNLVLFEKKDNIKQEINMNTNTEIDMTTNTSTNTNTNTEIDMNTNTNNEILAMNSIDNSDLNSYFDNIINNTEKIDTSKILNSKSSSLETMNTFMNERIFKNINPINNKIIYNSILPIQTREDRKLN